METIWNPESPSLLPAIVCYGDILGFSALTKSAFASGEEGEFLQRIKGSLSAAYDTVREYAKPWEGKGPPFFDMKVFTDDIVVAHPLTSPAWDLGEPEVGSLLLLFAHVQASLAADGFILRGGIAAGQHYQDQDIVYGEALLEAVDLNKSGKPPRLTIGTSVGCLISQHLSWYAPDSSPYHSHLLEDPSDGRFFVNYLDVAFEHFPWGEIGHELLEAHRQMLSRGLQKYEAEPDVHAKYKWLAAYHNYVCRAFADEYGVPVSEDAAPDATAAIQEALSVLEYVVPLEPEPPAELLPRPLDPKNLQQHLDKG